MTNAQGATIVLRNLSNDRIGTRFQRIGGKMRFNRLLNYFRDNFPLAVCEELESASWWLIAASQRPDVLEFARRFGLQVVES